MCSYYNGNTCALYKGITRNPRARALKCREYEYVVTYCQKLGLAFFGNRKEQS